MSLFAICQITRILLVESKKTHKEAKAKIGEQTDSACVILRGTVWMHARSLENIPFNKFIQLYTSAILLNQIAQNQILWSGTSE